MYELVKIKDGKGNLLKQHHHVWLNGQFIVDCHMWLQFLAETQTMSICRPFVDFSSNSRSAVTLQLFSDASRNPRLGMGVVFLEENRWIVGQWTYQFIVEQQPSIEFLELIAVVAAVVTWNKIEQLNNQRVEIFCDNEAVVHMINNTASSCPQCHKLITILTLDCICGNRRLFAHHIDGFGVSLQIP